jgi:hypothetical protein
MLLSATLMGCGGNAKGKIVFLACAADACWQANGPGDSLEKTNLNGILARYT